MMVLFSNISEYVIMEHDVLPAHCSVQIKIYFIHFVFGLHLDEEVLVIEDSVYE